MRPYTNYSRIKPSEDIELDKDPNNQSYVDKYRLGTDPYLIYT